MIGVDAARWFLLARSHETPVELDVELARSAVQREPRLLRAIRARADRVAAGPARRRRGSRAPPSREAWRRRRAVAPAPSALLVMSLLAFPGEFAEAIERRARPSGRVLRARAGAELHRLLPRLPRHRRRAGADQGAADLAVAGHDATPRALPVDARDRRAAADVGRASCPPAPCLRRSGRAARR